MAVPVLLLSIAWLLQWGVCVAVRPSLVLGYLKVHPAAVFGDILQLGPAANEGNNALGEPGMNRAQAQSVRSHLDRGLAGSREARPGYAERQDEEKRVKERILFPPPVEISNLELDSADLSSHRLGGTAPAVSATLAGGMPLRSTVGTPITLSGEDNPYCYMQQEDCAVAGEFSGSCTITKVELGFLISATVLLLLGLGAGACFAVGNSYRQPAENHTGVKDSEPVMGRRVLRLRLNSQE